MICDSQLHLQDAIKQIVNLDYVRVILGLFQIGNLLCIGLWVHYAYVACFDLPFE
jgi:hypothetical protein